MIFKKNTFQFLIFAVFFIILACDNKEKMSEGMFTGKWVEKESNGLVQYEGTNHIIKFAQDSFFLERKYWTDALSPNNPCVNGHIVYFKGIYQIEENQITFNGKSTNSNFIFATPECDRTATYQETFEFEQESDNILIFNPMEEAYFQIRLEKED